MPKHCCSFPEPMLSTWKLDGWECQTFQVYFMTAFHRNLHRTAVRVSAPARMGGRHEHQWSSGHIPRTSQVLWKCLTGLRTTVFTPSSSRSNNSIVSCMLWFCESGKNIKGFHVRCSFTSRLYLHLPIMHKNIVLKVLTFSKSMTIVLKWNLTVKWHLFHRNLLCSTYTERLRLFNTARDIITFEVIPWCGATYKS